MYLYCLEKESHSEDENNDEDSRDEDDKFNNMEIKYLKMFLQVNKKTQRLIVEAQKIFRNKLEESLNDAVSTYIFSVF